MKKAFAIFICLIFLSSCHANESVDEALSLRNKIIAANSCTFSCVITADYSDRLYTFQMACSFDKNGSMTFTVQQPETISGISGTIDGAGGRLTFDDQALFFEMLADGYISPVSAPWLFMKTLRSGYIDSCTAGKEGCYITVDDSYEGKPLLIEIWTDRENLPYRAELLWEGRRVLSLDVTDFSCV